MKRKKLLWCIIAVFLLMVSVVSVCELVQKDIAGGIVRLHIIANSDESDDQRVKLLVRDEMILRQNEIFSDGIQKTLSKKQKEKLTDEAIKVLRKQGINYDVRVETGNFYFPTKRYENITLPAGYYDAVRVVLGKGEGQNWWCVMYPPLCFNDSAIGKADKESVDILRKSMSEFEYDIISKESIKVVPAFKLVETWQIIKEKIKNSL